MPLTALLHRRPLAALLLTNFLASILHFGDNMLHFAEYPEPAWITGPHIVDAAWFIMTPLLALGWFAAVRGRKWIPLAALWIYAGLSMFTLGHYWYGSASSLSFRINSLIILEATAAALLIVLAPVALRARGIAPR